MVNKANQMTQLLVLLGWCGGGRGGWLGGWGWRVEGKEREWEEGGVGGTEDWLLLLIYSVLAEERVVYFSGF